MPFHLILRVSNDKTLNSAVLQLRNQGIKTLCADDHNRKVRQKYALVNWTLGAHSPRFHYIPLVFCPHFTHPKNELHTENERKNDTKNLVNEFYDM